MTCEGLNKMINYKNKNLNAKGLKKSVKQNGLDAGGKMQYKNLGKRQEAVQKQLKWISTYKLSICMYDELDYT